MWDSYGLFIFLCYVTMLLMPASRKWPRSCEESRGNINVDRNRLHNYKGPTQEIQKVETAATDKWRQILQLKTVYRSNWKSPSFKHHVRCPVCAWRRVHKEAQGSGSSWSKYVLLVAASIMAKEDSEARKSIKEIKTSSAEIHSAS